MTTTDPLTVADLARQIASGEVDITESSEKPRSDLEHRREIAMSYTFETQLSKRF